MSDYELDEFGGNFKFKKKSDDLPAGAWWVIGIVCLMLIGSCQANLDKEREARQHAAGQR
jgi:hypothetical protein